MLRQKSFNFEVLEATSSAEAKGVMGRGQSFDSDNLEYLESDIVVPPPILSKSPEPEPGLVAPRGPSAQEAVLDADEQDEMLDQLPFPYQGKASDNESPDKSQARKQKKFGGKKRVRHKRRRVISVCLTFTDITLIQSIPVH